MALRDGFVSSQQTEHIPALDGMRGLAILLVILLHWDPFSHAWGINIPYYLRFFRIGWIGVDLFFVLSGFLITGILLRSKGAVGYFKNFYIRRTLRIFPLYYTFLALSLIVLPNWSWFTSHYRYTMLPWGEFSYWLFLSNFAHGIGLAKHGFLVVTWSLSIEEQFYLVWPLLVARYSQNTLQRIILIYLCIVPLLRASLLFGLGNSVLLVDYCTPLRLDGLLSGSLVAIVWQTKNHPWLALMVQYSKTALPFLGMGVIGVLVLQELLLFQEGKYMGQNNWNQAFGVSIVSQFASVLLITILSAAPGSFCARCFEFGWLRVLGKYSFSAYLFHEMIYQLIGIEFKRVMADLPPLVYSVILFLLSGIVLAFVVRLTDVAIEAPFQRLKRFFPTPVSP
jgi:peptidoglycan/LPS O-acetylase OafA/YrhL